MRVFSAIAITAFLTAIPAVCAADSTGCEWCDVAMLSPNGSSSAGAATAADLFWTQGEAETNKIDVLLIFDRGAREWVKYESGFASCEDFANEAVLEMNAALANTELDELFTFRLVGVCTSSAKLSGYYPSDIATKAATLSGIKGKERAFYEWVRSERDAAKADVTAILTAGFPSEGIYGSGVQFISRFYDEESIETYKDYAYCACDVRAVQSRYTLLHEIGHIMGAGHSDEMRYEAGPQLFDYSAGYYFRAGGKRYATIMASNFDGYSDEEATRLPFFSSPEFTMLLTDSSGNLYDSKVVVGTADKNDNTRTLRETYAIVSNFRVATQLDKLPEDPRKIALAVSVGSDELDDGDVVYAWRKTSCSIDVAAASSLATTISVSGLPAGFSFNATTGRISGVPKKAGKYTVTITATNSKYTSSRTITIVSQSLPLWARGVFDGYVVVDGEIAATSVSISSAGAISGYIFVNGAKRKFSATGFTSSEMDESGFPVFSRSVTVSLSATDKRNFTLCVAREPFDDRSGETLSRGMAFFDEVESELLEDLWSTSAVSNAVVAKKRIVSVKTTTGGDTGLAGGDTLKFMLKSEGVGKFKGEIGGVEISGTSKFIRLGREDSSTKVELAAMPVIVPSQNNAGSVYAKMAHFRILVGTDGKVAGLKLTHMENISD